MYDYYNDTIKPLETFANDPDEVLAIGLGIASAMNNGNIDEMWETFPVKYQDDIKAIIRDERPYVLGGYYSVLILRWLQGHPFSGEGPLFASDVHAFAYGIDQVYSKVEEKDYLNSLPPEGQSDVTVSVKWFDLGQKVGSVIRWFL